MLVLFFWWLFGILCLLLAFFHSVVFNRSLLAINETACIVLLFFFLFSEFILREIIHHILPKTMHASRHDVGKGDMFICSVAQQVARAFNDQGGGLLIYIYASHSMRTHVSYSRL